MSKNSSILLSVVVPVFNEEESLPELWKLLSAVLKENYDNWEMIFVDDGSKDNTLKHIKKIAENDNKVRFISFSRNFGISGYS